LIIDYCNWLKGGHYGKNDADFIANSLIERIGGVL
jgi:hypothetical protein